MEKVIFYIAAGIGIGIGIGMVIGAFFCPCSLESDDILPFIKGQFIIDQETYCHNFAQSVNWQHGYGGSLRIDQMTEPEVALQICDCLVSTESGHFITACEVKYG